jgi:hypothetical protein
MRHRTVLAALMAIACGSLPASAVAQGPFPTYRQAAADQYGSPSQQPSEQPVGGQSGPGRRPATGSSGGGALPASQTGGSRPANPVRVAPESATGELARGSLPFTGRDLTLVVLLAVGLLAAGALCAAAARATRRRRAA